MATVTVTVTRKTIVGYGYTSACEQVWNSDYTKSSLRVSDVSAPIHTGTLKSVYPKIQGDRTLASFRGGTMYAGQWFVKVDGEWRRVTDQWFGQKTDELYSEYGKQDAVEVEVE